MYLYAACSTIDESQKSAYYSKAGKNYEKSGNFGQAGDMYRSAINSTEDENQKSIYYSKAGENYAKSGNFRQAGSLYKCAANSTEDESQKSHYQSKAIENYVKAIWLQQGSDLQAAIGGLAKIGSPAIQALTTFINDPKMVSMRNKLLDALGTARAKAPRQNNIPICQFFPDSLDLKRFPTGNPRLRQPGAGRARAAVPA